MVTTNHQAAVVLFSTHDNSDNTIPEWVASSST